MPHAEFSDGFAYAINDPPVAGLDTMKFITPVAPL